MPFVEIACDVFEGDETDATLEFPNTDFVMRLRRDISNEPQNLDVKLYCAIGYMINLARTPDEVKALLSGEVHCEGCVADIVGEVLQKRKRLKKTL